MGIIIGIDLGTTNSVCSYVDRNEPRIMINEEGGRVTPSIVGFAEDGSRFVGDVAKRQMVLNPEHTIYGIKRFIGRKYRDCVNEATAVTYQVVEADNGECAVSIMDREYSAQEVSAMILQKIKNSAEDFLGEPVTEAVITVPAYFTDSQRQATRDAGTIAGLDVLRIINEPTAAALAYVHERQAASLIAVYDFGGGTFDISLLKVDQDIAEVRATRGNNVLGGADIDRLVSGWLEERFTEEHGTDFNGDQVVLQRLRDAAERAKIELSSATTTEIHLPFLVADHNGPKHLQATLTRDQLEDMIRPLVDETIHECQQALKDANIDVKDLDEIIMVGGSSRIPLVQERVQKLFKQQLNKGFNPDEVVGIGAALQAGILEGDVHSVTLLDVTNFSLGIEVQGGKFATLIPKNSPIPTQATRLVSTVVDNQRTVKIHVLQGENKMSRSNVSLGQFELGNVQPAERGEPRIEVRFGIDANGMVNVSAKDLRTGLSEQVTIKAPTSISQTDLDEMKASLDKKASTGPDLIQVSSDLERKLSDVDAFMRRHKADLAKDSVRQAERVLKRGRMALLGGSDPQELLDLISQLDDELSTLQNLL
jgi:molecular chaperone DnaK